MFFFSCVFLFDCVIYYAHIDDYDMYISGSTPHKSLIHFEFIVGCRMEIRKNIDTINYY